MEIESNYMDIEIDKDIYSNKRKLKNKRQKVILFILNKDKTWYK